MSKQSICSSYLVFLIWMILLHIVLLISPASCAEDYIRADFPDDFVFGSGASAYQVEGAVFEDGRTPSIWDTFVHNNNGNAPEGNGDIACDQYHKYKDDVQLMAKIGLEAYRFSISWSRLIPNGRGPINPKGLQYYNNLINELIKHGIEPHVTLHHIDAPQILQDEYDGWLNRKIIKDFTGYAEVCFKEFGDRVKHWTTINEPNIFTLGGYDIAIGPPGRCSSPFGFVCEKGNSTVEPYIALHNMLLSHASVYRLYQKKYKAIQQGFVGANIYAPWFLPSSNSTQDVMATQRAKDFFFGWFVNPLVFGDYPETVKENAGTKIPVLTRYESKLVKGSFDFLGLNHYYTVLVKDSPNSLERGKRDVLQDIAAKIKFQIPGEKTSPNQDIENPVHLSALLEYLKQTYGNPPIYIHENGGQMDRNGTLDDVPRVKYLQSYIGNMLDAIRNGSNTRGYFQWSFLDGYELLDGFKSAYGLYYVDLNDEKLPRYPKLSSYWYSDFLKSRRSILPQQNVFVAKATQ